MPPFYRAFTHFNWFVYLWLGTALVAQGQSQTPVTEPVIKLGHILAADLKTDPYPQDTTAEAVVIYDYGSLQLEIEYSSLYMVSRYHIRTKIRRRSAYDRATITRALRKGASGEQERITNLEGYTYNLVNGAVEITQLDKSGIFLEKASDQVTLQKFTLPSVREGSIIDYSFTVHTPFSVTNNPPTWTFQQHIPVVWSELNAIIPNYSQYKIITSGYLPLTISDRKPTTCTPLPGHLSNEAVKYRFVVKDAPAFRPEAFITTESDYISKVDFELASFIPSSGSRQNISLTWEALDATLMSESTFGGQYKRAPFLRDVAELIKKQHPDSLGRMRAAHKYICQTMKWDETNGMGSTSIRKAFDARKGDAGDINLLLIGLLRELDFEANPVVLSTRAHGQVDESFPLIKKFNYVVAHVSLNGKDVLLDATDPYLKPGMLPRNCLNGSGRLVQASKSRFVSLVPTERDMEVISATFALGDEGELSGVVEQSYNGYKALVARKALGTVGQTKFVDAVRKSRVAWQIEEAAVSNADSITKPLNVTYKLTIPEACQLAGDRLYLRPMLTEGRTDNQFKNPERRYPVDFGAPIDEIYVATFTLPKGVVVEEAPKSAAIALPNNGGKFSYQVQVLDNKVTVASKITLRKPVYSVEEYPALREFYDKILAKHAEQIVMKRSTLANTK